MDTIEFVSEQVYFRNWSGYVLLGCPSVRYREVDTQAIEGYFENKSGT